MNKLSNIVNHGGENYLLEWYPANNEQVIKSLNPVRQVYGVCFDKNGKIVIISTNKGKWGLPGGTPEGSETFKQTLSREVIEEANIKIEKISILGYQKVTNLRTKEVIYQIRCFAFIKKILKREVDPAQGKILKRKFILPEEFDNYSRWGIVGKAVIDSALKRYNKLLNNN